MTLLCARHLTVSLRQRSILRDVSFDVGGGECIGLLGPNGAGKTTLMRALLRLVPSTGENSLSQLPLAERARIASWMPQTREIAWPVTVETLIMLGRIPHLLPGQRPSPQDHEKVNEALAEMDLNGFRHRTATQLSGGEQARVLIARALAQDTPLIMADEPVAGLDPAHQITTMQSFAALARAGRSVIVSLHDIGLAARHCTRVMVLSKGALVADGPPGEMLTQDRLASVFGIKAYHQETQDGTIFQPVDVIL
ncbi:MAG: ABC transporter ATP-binding protein [Pseudomonadota bacterium]